MGRTKHKNTKMFDIANGTVHICLRKKDLIRQLLPTFPDNMIEVVKMTITGTSLDTKLNLKFKLDKNMSLEDLSIFAKEAKRLEIFTEPILNKRIADIPNLSVRARRALNDSNIDTLGELVTYNEKKLKSKRNVGVKTMADIYQMMNEFNIKFLVK